MSVAYVLARRMCCRQSAILYSPNLFRTARFIRCHCSLLILMLLRPPICCLVKCDCLVVRASSVTYSMPSKKNKGEDLLSHYAMYSLITTRITAEPLNR